MTTWTEDIHRSNNIANDIDNSILASFTFSPSSDSSANSKTAKAYSSQSSSDSENSESPPTTVPTSLSTSSSSLPIPNMDVAILAQERRHVTKYAKKRRINLLMANDIKRMMTVHAIGRWLVSGGIDQSLYTVSRRVWSAVQDMPGSQ